ncbi:MAG: SDH family Clp fold serine proteinase [Verrucomicrobiota bacterium]
MASWHDILNQIQSDSANCDKIRRGYLNELAKYTGRPAIAYYSGFNGTRIAASPQDRHDLAINDNDMNGFMAVIHQLPRDRGLDLILNTPGGDVAATEAIVNYLHYAFGKDIRAIVPQQAMSAGTMIALACTEVIMGMHSSLGPIDPQIGGVPAHGIIEEFEKIQKAFREDPKGAMAYRPILERYSPTTLGNCEKAIEMAGGMVRKWLGEGMLSGVRDKEAKLEQILKHFGDHSTTLNHARHISYEQVKASGITVKRLEDYPNCPELQDRVLSVHHAMMVTFGISRSLKIIENSIGATFVRKSVKPTGNAPV